MEEIKSQKAEILEIEIESVIEQVNKLGCTYPAEVSRATLIPKERCISIIYKLLKEGKIYRLKLSPIYVPVEMLPRLANFWSMGIHGYEMFGVMTWIIPKRQIPISHQYDNPYRKTEPVEQEELIE